MNREEARAALAVVALTLVVYVATMYPDVPGGDSGEIIGALATGGVIHPPGYPLYALLGRLFLHLPLGSLAWRVNLFSATCDALAAGVLFVAVARWSRSRWGGLAAAGLFAFAPGVWMSAISAEVFALNNLFVAGLLLLAVRYAEGKEHKYAYAGALVSGLALTNHQTALFVIAPLGVWMVWTGRRDLLRLRPLLTLALLFSAGLLPYLLLLQGARAGAVVSWGETDTWRGLWAHVLRRDYGPLHAATGQGGASPSGTLGAWVADLGRQIGWWGTPFLLLGLAQSVRDREHARLGIAVPMVPLLAVLVFSALWGLTVADPLHREILARFWQEPDIVCVAWCGWGVAELGRLTGAQWVQPVVATGLALGALGQNAGEMDHHRSRVVRDYGAEILRAAPAGALLFTKGDLITNTTRYLQLAEGVRPDVQIVDQELLGYPWYVAQVARRYPDLHLPGRRYMPGAEDGFFMKQLLDANFGRRPILICGGVKQGDLTADASYGRWPYGLCEVVHRGDEPINVDEWLAESEVALPRIAFAEGSSGGLRARESFLAGSWESVAWGDYWEVRANRGVQLITVAGADPARRRYLAVAASIFEGIIDANPEVEARVYKDLVIALGREGLETPEDRARQVAALRHYLKVAPPDDPLLPGFERELARLAAP